MKQKGLKVEHGTTRAEQRARSDLIEQGAKVEQMELETTKAGADGEGNHQVEQADQGTTKAEQDTNKAKQA